MRLPFQCQINTKHTSKRDRLCGLVVRVPGYRSRGFGFHSRRYQIFWEVVGLERGPLSLVRIIEELFEWKSRGSGQANRINDRGDPLRWPRNTVYPQKLALTWPTSGGRSVGIVHLRTKGYGVFFINKRILKIHVGTIKKRHTRLYPSREIAKYRNLPLDD
jgi:hypothetical protein